MIFEFLNMIILGFLIGLTGALAPGPTLIATINASLKRGWSAGPLVTLGHIMVEVVMVGLIVAGLSLFIGDYAWLIAGIGGFALVIFGILTLLESRQAYIDITGNNQPTTSPFLAGSCHQYFESLFLDMVVHGGKCTTDRGISGGNHPRSCIYSRSLDGGSGMVHSCICKHP